MFFFPNFGVNTISQKFCCRKEAWGYAKAIHKNRKEKKKRVEKKWTSV